MDIKIKQLHKQEFKDLKCSKLVVEFSGDTIHPSLVNSFRRMAMQDVPTYAFCDESIIIEMNTSKFDNDYMNLRLQQFTVPKIDVPVTILDDKYWKYVDYSDLNREKHQTDNNDINLVINTANLSNDTINVTTNDTKLYIDGVLSEKFDKKYPLLIVKLLPNEVFKCTMKAVLGCGIRNNIWESAISYIEYDNIDKIKLTLESNGQMDEYNILHKCCEIMENKLKTLKERIDKNFNTPEITSQTYLKIVFDGESHTFGEVLNYFLQNNKNIGFSGVSKPDLLKDEIVIKIKSVSNNPLIPLFESMDYLVKVYEMIDVQIQKLGKNFIVY